MRVISYNVNGIRAAIKKGFVEWLSENPADIICLQETKATKEDVDTSEIEKLGYTSYWFSAQKKGYSGVAIFTKIKPDNVVCGTGIEQSDFEGRVIQADFGPITIVNAYFPSGTSGDERQNYKYQWLSEFEQYLAALRKKRPQLIVVGDYNIAHREIDIHDPKGNKKSSGFLPEERAWLSALLESGFTDSFRQVNTAPDQYSWWSYRANSRANNKGWRLDYALVSKPLDTQILNAQILSAAVHSDHCPVTVEISL